MDKEEKMYLFSLSSLKTDNVANVYTKNFLLWRYENSDTVTLDGKPIEPGIERYLMRLPNEDGESNLKGEGMVSDTKDGLPLKEIHFIEQEIRKYKPLFEKSIGSELNQTPHAKLEIYLDYLNNRKTQLESQTQPEEKPQYIINESTTLPIKAFKLKTGVTDAIVKKYYDALINNKSIDCSIEEFKTVFSDEDKLPDNWKPIRWLRVKEKEKKGTPHKSGLAAIIIELLDVKQSNPDIITMSRFFVDNNGNNIEPSLKQSKKFLAIQSPHIK